MDYKPHWLGSAVGAHAELVFLICRCTQIDPNIFEWKHQLGKNAGCKKIHAGKNK